MWISAIGMLLLVLLINSIRLPSSDNTAVGVGGISGEDSQRILDILRQKGNDFKFIEYEDNERLQADVKSGKLECGFIFKDGFEKKFKRAEAGKNIDYYSNPFSTKGAVAREVFSAGYIEAMSDYVLEKNLGDYVAEVSEEKIEYLRQRKEYFYNSEDIFDIDIEEIDKVDSIANGNTNTVNTIKGCVSLIIFIYTIMLVGRKFEAGTRGFLSAMDRGRRLIYNFTMYVAAALPIATIGFGIICCFTEGIHIAKEVLSMLVFCVLCGIWAMLLDLAMKRGEAFISLVLTIIVVSILACPIFFDISTVIPAMKYIAYILPMGIYLRI